MHIAGTREPPGEQCRDPGVQIGLTRQRGIERFELLCRLKEQRWSVGAGA